MSLNRLALTSLLAAAALLVPSAALAGNADRPGNSGNTPAADNAKGPKGDNTWDWSTQGQ